MTSLRLFITMAKESNALTKLNNEGKFLKAGETLQYVITDYYQTRSKNNRAIPIELINERTCYDVKRHIELLTEACNSITEPFGFKLTLPPILNIIDVCFKIDPICRILHQT
jgi:DNA polymerase elongation subunit (family B)